MSITQKSGNFASDVISREQNNIKSQAAIIRLAQDSIAKSEARIKAWSDPIKFPFECDCNDPVGCRHG